MVRAKVIAIADSLDFERPLNVETNQIVGQVAKRTLVVQSLNQDTAKVFARSGRFFSIRRHPNCRRFMCETALRKSAWGRLSAESFGLPLWRDLSSGCPLHAADDYPLHIRVYQGLAIMTEGVMDRATLAIIQSED